MRRICVFTGSRADYGPLRMVVLALDRDPEIDVRLIVAGGHLLDTQGLTVRDIKRDGLRVDEEVEMVLASDTPAAVAKSTGLAMISLADALSRVDPDILVVLGDRYESLAAAYTAYIRSLPIAHIGGGDQTQGSTDEAARHAITKLAHLHFTANESSRRRVIQMGEHPSRVYATGLPSLDAVAATHFLEHDELGCLLGLRLIDPVMAVTYHPATADQHGTHTGVRGMLTALEMFPEATLVFTGTNVDQHSSQVSKAIRDFARGRQQQSVVVPSLGQTAFLSLIKLAAVVVGNSSAGLIEAPALGTPTVNIGTRQDGRSRADSVIDSGEAPDEIAESIRQALSFEHKLRAQTAHSPFGDGHSAERICTTIKTFDLGLLTPKHFFDTTAYVPTRD